jgi:hypothetical protein
MSPLGAAAGAERSEELLKDASLANRVHVGVSLSISVRCRLHPLLAAARQRVEGDR